MAKKYATRVRVCMAIFVVLLNIISTDAQVSDHVVVSTAKNITCPPGKHAYANGSTTTCKSCPDGFFSASVSSDNVGSCTAHTKCPPGKYTQTAGNATSQPKCNTCMPGFYKNSTSISSTCAGASSRSGKGGDCISKHCRTTYALSLIHI